MNNPGNRWLYKDGQCVSELRRAPAMDSGAEQGARCGVSWEYVADNSGLRGLM